MPFLAIIIGLIIVLILLGGALFFGVIGAAKGGPDPSEGSNSTG